MEVRSRELDTGLSFSDKAVEADTAVSMPLSLNPSSSSHIVHRAFHALKEECSLDEDTLFKLGIGSKFLMRRGIVCLVQTKKLVPSLLGRCVFMRLLT